MRSSGVQGNRIETRFSVRSHRYSLKFSVIFLSIRAGIVDVAGWNMRLWCFDLFAHLIYSCASLRCGGILLRLCCRQLPCPGLIGGEVGGQALILEFIESGRSHLCVGALMENPLQVLASHPVRWKVESTGARDSGDTMYSLYLCKALSGRHWWRRIRAVLYLSLTTFPDRQRCCTASWITDIQLNVPVN